MSDPHLPILQKLVKVAPPIITANARPGAHCVMASAVGQIVLESFGITAEPFSVEATVCNQAWYDWGGEGFKGGVEEQRRRGAHILTNTPNWQGDSIQSKVTVHAPWDGHLVLVVGHTLVDLDIGSFARPAHHIYTPAGMLGPLSPNRTVEGTWTYGGHRTYVVYRPMVSSFADEYLTAPDWVKRERLTEVAWDIEQTMRR